MTSTEGAYVNSKGIGFQIHTDTQGLKLLCWVSLQRLEHCLLGTWQCHPVGHCQLSIFKLTSQVSAWFFRIVMRMFGGIFLDIFTWVYLCFFFIIKTCCIPSVCKYFQNVYIHFLKQIFILKQHDIFSKVSRLYKKWFHLYSQD